MFQIKDFASIVASCINWMKSTQNKVTDFNIGSVARTLVEAPAAEMDELYQQMFIGLKEAIPVSVYNSFSFDALPALPTSGLVRVTVTSSVTDTLIQAGTTFTVTGTQLIYTANADVTILAGDTVADVLVTASTAGMSNNIPASQAFTLAPSPSNLVSATNLSPWINGTDAESDDDRKVRFNAFIQALNRGTVAALEYGLKLANLTDAAGNVIEHVASTSIVEPWMTDSAQPIALVNCYIHNGVGSTSSDLVNRAREVIYGYYDASGNAVPGWKAAGVKVNVYAAQEVVLDIGGELTPLAGFDEATLITEAEAAADTYVATLGIGKTFQVADLIEEIMSIEGVDNFVPADIAAPAAPTLGSTAGGSLGATTYYVVVSYITPAGETLASAEASLAVLANHLLTVTSPAARTGVTGWNVYVGTTAGVYEKQNGSLQAIGTNYTEPTSGLVAGASPPAASTARLIDVSVSASQKLMPGTITIT